jgi:hypothetical protein
MQRLIRYIASVFGVNTFLLLTLLMVVITSCHKQVSQREPMAVTCEACVVQAVTNSNSYAQGEPITVTATVSVLNDTNVGFDYNRRSINFELRVIDEQGQAVSMTKSGTNALGSFRNSYIPSWGISPDKPFQEVFRIDTWFELSEPGTYTLTVKKRLRVGEATEFGYVEVIGNPVSFTRLP